MVVLAILAGLVLGYLFERGDFCFHSTLRGLWRRPPHLALFRAYGLALLVATPLVSGLRALGLIDPWIPPFVWPANLIGGVIFGVGMVVAATCVTGMFYKLGHGMLGTLVALLFWAIGDIMTYQGPFAAWRDRLNGLSLTAPAGQSATIPNLFGPVGLIFVIGLGLGLAIWLWRSPQAGRGAYWDWPKLGLAVGLFTAFAWLLAQAGGSNYTFGTSGVPTSLYLALTEGSPLWSTWISLALLSMIPGAIIAARQAKTMWLRGETLSRYLQLAGGGFLMGLGAAISGGCNLGHSLVGVPLLALGSITTTLAMAAGVGLAHAAGQLFKRTEPGVVGPKQEVTF